MVGASEPKKASRTIGHESVVDSYSEHHSENDHTKLKMFKAQLLVLYLTIYVQNSSPSLLSTLDLVERAINVIGRIEEIYATHPSVENIASLFANDGYNLDNPLVQDIIDLWDMRGRKYGIGPYGIPGNDGQWIELTHLCDSHYEFWREIMEDPTMKNWIHTRNCLETKKNYVREMMYREFSTRIDKATNGTNGECVGLDEFEAVQKLYFVMINIEVTAHVMGASVHTDSSSNNRVAQPTTPDYGIGLKNQYLNYTGKLLSFMKAIQPHFSADCNGKNTIPTQDESFVELTGFFKETIFQYDNNECSSLSCDAILEPDYIKRCNTTWINEAAACHGDSSTCAWLGDSEACLSAFEDKYRYVQSSEVQGRSENCSVPGDKLIKISNSLSSPFSTCHCHCMSNQWRINLAPIETISWENRIIVGVRFVVVNRILTLQAAEGTLRSLGYVTDFRWIPVENVYCNSEQITSHNLRFIFEDLRLEPGHVITGIRLTPKKVGSNPTMLSGFSIQIEGSSFDVEGGFRDFRSSSPNNVYQHDFQKELQFELVNPIQTDKANDTEPSPPGYTHVKFQQSRLDADFGQSTLPLFDAPSYLIPKKMKALSGLKMYHRGSKHHSGFISLEYHQMDGYNLDDYIRELETRGMDL